MLEIFSFIRAMALITLAVWETVENVLTWLLINFLISLIVEDQSDFLSIVFAISVWYFWLMLSLSIVKLYFKQDEIFEKLDI